jgi:hypothetical protein
MITKAIIKIAKRAVKKSGQQDPELELAEVKAQVNALDSRENCVYFDRFTKSVRNK